MKVILANPRGFCAGVHMAIDTVQELIDLIGPPLWVFHEIVHNKHVVERFVEQGVTFVDSIDEVPERPDRRLQRPRRLARGARARQARAAYA